MSNDFQTRIRNLLNLRQRASLNGGGRERISGNCGWGRVSVNGAWERISVRMNCGWERLDVKKSVNGNDQRE